MKMTYLAKRHMLCDHNPHVGGLDHFQLIMCMDLLATTFSHRNHIVTSTISLINYSCLFKWL